MSRHGIAFAAFFLCAFPLTATAGLTVCNATADPVSVAVSYVSPRGGFVSEGWWKLNACRGCQELVLDSDTSDRHNYFIYAKEVGGSSVWEGNSPRCTTSKRFKISGPQTANGWCTSRGYAVHMFKHVPSRSGNHKETLTGVTRSGRCID
jgi:uncharacterized membrane protein